MHGRKLHCVAGPCAGERLKRLAVAVEGGAVILAN